MKSQSVPTFNSYLLYTLQNFTSPTLRFGFPVQVVTVYRKFYLSSFMQSSGKKCKKQIKAYRTYVYQKDKLRFNSSTWFLSENNVHRNTIHTSHEIKILELTVSPLHNKQVPKRIHIILWYTMLVTTPFLERIRTP